LAEGASQGPLVTALTPVNGWQYEGEDADANLGVTASFKVEEVRRGTIEYGPWRIVRLGYFLGAITLALAIFALLWRRTDKGTELA
jgi:hypothetical protein